MESLKKGETPADVPVGALPPQDWMSAAETKQLLAALSAGGAAPRFVGGCVRDSLAHRRVTDIDLATPDPPERIIFLLEQAGLRAIPTGLAHGTVTAIVGTRKFEITSLRRDIETDGRHAVVAFTDDWVADAARRDFTVNALSCGADGLIFDPFGGIGDLADGVIRFVGDPKQRIVEDALRILRFFRFFALFGRPPMDAFALAACRQHVELLKTLSAERIAAELFKLLAAQDPVPALLLMQEARVLHTILPELTDFGRLRVLCFLETRGVMNSLVAPDPLRRLASLVTADRSAALDLAGRLRLSNAERDRFAHMVEADLSGFRELPQQESRRIIYRKGVGLFCDFIMLAWADARSREGYAPKGGSAHWLTLLDLAESWVPPEFPIKGDDLIARGFAPGPEIGACLKKLEAWWEENDFHADRAALLQKIDEEHRL